MSTYIYDDKELIDLMKQIEKIYDSSQINKIDKEILNESADYVVPLIKSSAPFVSDLDKHRKNSGVFRKGFRHTIEKNAREYIGKSSIKRRGQYLSTTIDFMEMDYAFYLKFEEFGTSKIKKHPFMNANYDIAWNKLQAKKKKKYNELLNNSLK